jgi:hypothetical protein
MLKSKLQLKGLKSQKSSMVSLSNLVSNRKTACKFLGAGSWFPAEANLQRVVERCDEQIAERVEIIKNLEIIKSVCQEELINQALKGTTSVLRT